MYLSRKEMIYQVSSAFINDEYKKAIGKRLFNSFAITPLNIKNCKGLNEIVNLFNNPMLIQVYFEWTMSEKVFDNYISRLLYVSGKWVKLCYYQMLINDTSNLFYVNICNESETHIDVFFTTKDSNILMVVDDQKVGIKMVRTIKMEMEF